VSLGVCESGSVLWMSWQAWANGPSDVMCIKSGVVELWLVVASEVAPLTDIVFFRVVVGVCRARRRVGRVCRDSLPAPCSASCSTASKICGSVDDVQRLGGALV
jgi:hypothetical protein